MALNLFYQSLPNKLDSLEKIQTWYYGGKINSYLTDTYRHFAINQRTHKYTKSKEGQTLRELLYL